MNSTIFNNAYRNFMALPEVGWPTVVSAVLHISVFAFAVFGLPKIAGRNDVYIAPDEIVMNVELFDSSEIAEDKNIADDNSTPAPRVKPVYNNTDSVPVLAEPRQPDIDTKLEKQEEKSVVASDPTLIKIPPKPRSKPLQPKPKQIEKKPLKPKVQDKPERNITSLLKDLTPSDWANAQQRINSDERASGKVNQFGSDASQQMTSSDLVALNQGVQKCWNVNAGGRMAEKLEVRLRVIVAPNRKVKEVIILDKLRYATDPHFRSAAEAAQRALLNEQCSTLNLPPEKYEAWKSFIYTFDPSQML